MGAFHEDLLRKVNKYAARTFQEQLQNHQSPLEQLLDSGVTSSVIEEFGVGYATNGWCSLTEKLGGRREYVLDCARTVGLITRGDRGLRDRFRNRYVLPLKDTRGSVAGFTTVLVHALDDSFQPKPHDLVRMNSSHSPIFDKRNYLLGGTRVLQCASLPGELLVAPGPLETLKLHAQGHENVVSTLIPGAFEAAENGSITRRLFERSERVLTVGTSSGADANVS